MAVVVEPASRAIQRGSEKYSTIKMYLNGEEVACLGYIPGQNAISQNTPIMLDGREGDFISTTSWHTRATMVVASIQ